MAIRKVRGSKSLRLKLPKSKRANAALFVGIFAVAGVTALLVTHAAMIANAFIISPLSGKASGGASVVSDSTAVGGKTVQFGAGSASGGSTGGGSGTNGGSGGGTNGGSGAGGGSGSGSGSGSSSGPYATALSSYKTLSQSYTASQMISGNWAKNANDTQEGGGTCPTNHATYDSADNAVELITQGTAGSAGSNTDCGHIRSANLVSTDGTVVESKVWLPGSGKTLIDWASYWTDGTNWSQTGELDAIETQYGVSYASYHYGTNNSTMSTTPAGWGAQPAPVNNPANDAVPGWNVVDMEFEPNYAGANVYINGKLYASFPGSILPHNGQYINWGISGPNADDPNHSSWPSGASHELVQYLKVFTK